MPVWFDNGSRSTTTKSKKRRTNNYRLFRLKSMSECERAGLFPPGRSSSILFTVPPASSSFSTQQQQQNNAETTKCTTEIESRKKKKGQAEQYSQQRKRVNGFFGKNISQKGYRKQKQKSFGNSSRSIRNSQMQQQQRLQKRNPRVQSENNYGQHRSRHDTSIKKSTQTLLRWIVENSEQLVKNQRNKGQPVTPEGNLMRNQLLASLRKLSLADTKLDVTRAGEEISEVLGIHYKQPTSVFSFNTTVTANATTSDCITTTTDSTSTCNALQKLQNTPLLERVINACSLAGLVDLSIEILYTVLKTDDESGIHGMTKLSPGGICYISILQSLRKMKRLPKMKEVLLRMGMHSINNTDSASFLDNPNVDCEDGYVNIVAFNVYLAALCDNQSQLKTDSS
eukprot:CAMPEP_0194419080 /NCGR_PEP_ID=MMETSP0176-20130528/18340_1 /TAXON_ID=216777 /ORGANISM="Proboscia alata, Strain PI-D3" /LENGTH=396 /DNA_ID=CAMNT_0039225945 /DNA_START=340 /DNA_END=1528 /DNA_ORIENTATION=+